MSVMVLAASASLLLEISKVVLVQGPQIGKALWWVLESMLLLAWIGAVLACSVMGRRAGGRLGGPVWPPRSPGERPRPFDGRALLECLLWMAALVAVLTAGSSLMRLIEQAAP